MNAAERWEVHKPLSWSFPVVLPNRAVIQRFDATCGNASCRSPIPDEDERGQVERVPAGVRFKAVGKCPACGQFSYSSGLLLVSRFQPGWELVAPPPDLIVDPWTREPVVQPEPPPEPDPEDIQLMSEAYDAVRHDEWSMTQTMIVILLAAVAVGCFWMGNMN